MNPELAQEKLDEAKCLIDEAVDEICEHPERVIRCVADERAFARLDLEQAREALELYGVKPVICST